jgi:hypothetical protein
MRQPLSRRRKPGLAENEVPLDRSLRDHWLSELGEGRLEAIYVAEERDGELRSVGQVRFGFAGKGLWHVLDERRAGPPTKGIVPVWLGLVADIKFFGWHKGGWIRDGVILSLR